MAIASEPVHSEHPVKLLSVVNGIERALRSNLAWIPAMSSFWTLFVEIYATERKSYTGVPWRPFNRCCSETLGYCSLSHSVYPTQYIKINSGNAKKVHEVNAFATQLYLRNMPIKVYMWILTPIIMTLKQHISYCIKININSWIMNP